MAVLRDIFVTARAPKGGGLADLLRPAPPPAARGPVARADESELPREFIAVPDIVQPDDAGGGACAAMSVGRYFGVGPKTLPAWRKALDAAEGPARPEAIAEYLAGLGLGVEAKENMTLADLTDHWRRGEPVIVMVRGYGRGQDKGPAGGRYLVVIGRDHGHVYVQDPSEDGVTHGHDSAAAPGRGMIADGNFLRVWHDRDADGRRYVRYGIAVGPGAGPEAELSTLAAAEQPALLLAYLDALDEAEAGDGASAAAANTLHELLTGAPGALPEPAVQLSTRSAAPLVRRKRTQIVWDDQDRAVEKIEEWVDGAPDDGGEQPC